MQEQKKHAEPPEASLHLFWNFRLRGTTDKQKWPIQMLNDPVFLQTTMKETRNPFTSKVDTGLFSNKLITLSCWSPPLDFIKETGPIKRPKPKR